MALTPAYDTLPQRVSVKLSSVVHRSASHVMPVSVTSVASKLSVFNPGMRSASEIANSE